MKQPGALIAIGGKEDKVGERLILAEIARRVGTGKLVVTTVASHEPEGLFEEYSRIFRRLGCKRVHKLELPDRAAAMSSRKLKVLDDASALFFTGGDQSRITSQLADTEIHHRIKSIYESGGLVAGTSAGASVLCDIMVVGNGLVETHKVMDSLHMVRGLGLIGRMIIDQHFSERGRMGRLMGAIAQNPESLGIGIDEETAIVLDTHDRFRVVGSGAVHVIDGSHVTQSNIADEKGTDAISVFDMTVHLLGRGDAFDLKARRPVKL